MTGDYLYSLLPLTHSLLLMSIATVFLDTQPLVGEHCHSVPY